MPSAVYTSKKVLPRISRLRCGGLDYCGGRCTVNCKPAILGLISSSLLILGETAMDKRYQVFVSSTYADLKEERQHVIQALMEMDCIPSGMEVFPAADEEQWDFINVLSMIATTIC